MQSRQELAPRTAAKDRQRLRPAVHTPDGAGTGAVHVSRFDPGYVQVTGPTPRPALVGIRDSQPQLPGTESTPGPTRAHIEPQGAPCANVNTPPATQSVHLFLTASPANGNMGEVSPSQTLPFAGGKPPTSPGSVSALDPLIHHAGDN